jgi:hypothetical protein
MIRKYTDKEKSIVLNIVNPGLLKKGINTSAYKAKR